MEKKMKGMTVEVMIVTVVAAFSAFGDVRAADDGLPNMDDEGLFPFTFTTPAHHTVVDYSDWFAPPAGADGFVRAEGEKFVTDKGELFLNGINLAGEACFPTHEEAEELAKRLSRLGFNAARLDCAGTEIRPEMLGRYDYLVYALEKNGIYVNIVLGAETSLEKRCVRNFLTRLNPYTQRAFVDDPGIAIVEIGSGLSAQRGEDLSAFLKDEVKVKCVVKDALCKATTGLASKPSCHLSESIPSAYAYGAVQGRAGIFACTWNHSTDVAPGCTNLFFNNAGRVDIQAHLPACAAISRYGAVREARRRESVPSGDVWRADTGELVWNSSVKRESFVTCDTKSVKFFTGFAKGGKRVEFKDVTLDIGKTRLGFATVTMFARDRGGFGADGKPARILVSATGLVKDSGGVRTASSGEKRKRGPQLCEGVPATLTLKVPASRVRCWALDGAAIRKARVPVSADAQGNARIVLGPDYKTVWYEISVVEAARNDDADWMVGKLGVFLHWWPTPDNPDAARDFDVEGLVRDLKEIDPDFFFLTLGQNSGYYNGPNATYERYAGYERGSRCGRVRDLPAEIIAALKGTGIRMGLYAPCQPAFDDPKTEAKFGNLARTEDKNYYMTDRGIDKWADVVREWSDRYGEDVSLWWFDGGARYFGMTDAKAGRIAAAARSGNPRAVVSFNSGVLSGSTQVVNTVFCDFTAGEVNRGPSIPCRSRTVGGSQWFALTHLGSYWQRSDFNISDRSLWWWLRDVVTNGGAAALDMGRDTRTGRLDKTQVRRLAKIFADARTLRDFKSR